MRNLLGILAFALSLMPSAMFAQVSNNNEDGVYKTEHHNHRAFRQGEVIVKFKTGSAMGNMARSSSRVSAVSSMSRVMSEIGATAIEPLMPLTGELKQNAARSAKGFNGKDVEIKDMSTLYTVRFDETKQQDVHAVVDKLKTIDDVEFAEPNYLVYTTATGDGDLYKKDPLYNNNGHWGITGINIYNLWNTPKITTKRPVIAILDTGIDITHPDLAANIWTNKLENEGAEGRDDDANGFKDDIHGWDFVNNTPRIRDNNGHGTHCAGIAAAEYEKKCHARRATLEAKAERDEQAARELGKLKMLYDHEEELATIEADKIKTKYTSMASAKAAGNNRSTGLFGSLGYAISGTFDRIFKASDTVGGFLAEKMGIGGDEE